MKNSHLFSESRRGGCAVENGGVPRWNRRRGACLARTLGGDSKGSGRFRASPTRRARGGRGTARAAVISRVHVRSPVCNCFDELKTCGTHQHFAAASLVRARPPRCRFAFQAFRNYEDLNHKPTVKLGHIRSCRRDAFARDVRRKVGVYRTRFTGGARRRRREERPRAARRAREAARRLASRVRRARALAYG